MSEKQSSMKAAGAGDAGKAEKGEGKEEVEQIQVRREELKKDTESLPRWEFAKYTGKTGDEICKAMGFKELLLKNAASFPTGTLDASADLRDSFVSITEHMRSMIKSAGKEPPELFFRFHFRDKVDDKVLVCMDITACRGLPGHEGSMASMRDDLLMEVNYVTLKKKQMDAKCEEIFSCLHSLPPPKNCVPECYMTISCLPGEILLLSRILEHNAKSYLPHGITTRPVNGEFPGYVAQYHSFWRKSFLTTMDLSNKWQMKEHLDSPLANGVGCFNTQCEEEYKLAALTCSRCGVARYCDARCQKEHWRIHKQICVSKKALESGFVIVDLRVGDKEGGRVQISMEMILSQMGNDMGSKKDNLHIELQSDLELIKVQSTLSPFSHLADPADEQMTGVGQFVLYGKNHEWELLLLSADEATNMGQHTNVVAPGQAEAAGVPSSIDCSDGKHKALGYLIKIIKKATNTPGKTYLFCTRVEPGFLLIHTETSMPTQNW